MKTMKIDGYDAIVAEEYWHFNGKAEAPYGWLVEFRQPVVVLGSFDLGDAIDIAAEEADEDADENGLYPDEAEGHAIPVRALTRDEAWEAAEAIGADPYEAVGYTHHDFVEVCATCTIYLVNGDVPEDDDEWEPDDEFPSVNPAFSEETGHGYEEFSWQRCECCNAEAGARYRFAIIES